MPPVSAIVWKFNLFTHIILELIDLISRSGDSTARIWNISDGSSGSGLRNGLVNVLVLKHLKGKTNEKSKDVTTLDWNVSCVISFSI